MQLIATVLGIRQETAALRAAGRSIALVPTMGFLHEGHLSLMRLARKQGDAVVVSLFVNPTQFGPGEDFEAYPRDQARDEALCRRENVEVLFCPPVDALYAPDAGVWVNEEPFSKTLCGRERPGHFRGVLTVVAKLFNLVQPDAAVFGRKDAQQLRLIQRLARDLCFPVRIVAAPIVREADGLAMSSRNRYLSPEERREALCLRRALDAAEAAFAGGERRTGALRRAMLDRLAAASTAQVEYVELVDWATFAPVETIAAPTLAALAVRIGRTRLIDNTLLGETLPAE